MPDIENKIECIEVEKSKFIDAELIRKHFTKIEFLDCKKYYFVDEYKEIIKALRIRADEYYSEIISTSNNINTELTNFTNCNGHNSVVDSVKLKEIESALDNLNSFIEVYYEPIAVVKDCFGSINDNFIILHKNIPLSIPEYYMNDRGTVNRTVKTKSFFKKEEQITARIICLERSWEIHESNIKSDLPHLIKSVDNVCVAQIYCDGLVGNSSRNVKNGDRTNSIGLFQFVFKDRQEAIEEMKKIFAFTYLNAQF